MWCSKESPQAHTASRAGRGTVCLPAEETRGGVDGGRGGWEEILKLFFIFLPENFCLSTQGIICIYMTVLLEAWVADIVGELGSMVANSQQLQQEIFLKNILLLNRSQLSVSKMLLSVWFFLGKDDLHGG